jgi:hypothetical protein
MHMPNFNDAKITSLFVNAVGAAVDIQDDAPNAATPGGPFDVTLEMVAGNGLLTAGYTLTTTCSDITATQAAPATLVPGGHLNTSTETFGEAGVWKSVPPYLTFNQSVQVTGGTAGHVYQYTASLFNANGQVASIQQSDPFILL